MPLTSSAVLTAEPSRAAHAAEPSRCRQITAKLIAKYKHRHLSSWTKPLCIQTPLQWLPAHTLGEQRAGLSGAG